MFFYDRDIEREQLKGILADIESGDPKIVWIEGESGVGKTALLLNTIKEIEPKTLKFNRKSPLFKCTSRTAEQPFACISGLLVTFESRDSRLFNQVIETYTKKYGHLSLESSIVETLINFPLTSWSKGAFEGLLKKKEVITDAINRSTIERHLESCFTEIIKEFLSRSQYNNLVMCIDDVTNIDESSLDIILRVFSDAIISNNKTISLLLTSRGYYSVEDKEKYNNVDQQLRFSASNYIETINLSGFNKETTIGYLNSFNRRPLQKNNEVIFKITGGNLQELFQTTKLNDREITKKINNLNVDSHLTEKFQPIISQSILFEEMKDPIVKTIFTIIIFFSKPLSIDLIKKIALIFEIEKNLTFIHIDNIVFNLKNKELLSLNNNFLFFSHDSIKNIACDILIETNEFFYFIDKLSEICLLGETVSDEIGIEDAVYSPMKNYLDIDPLKVLSIFEKNKEVSKKNKHILKIAANALSRVYLNIESKYLVDISCVLVKRLNVYNDLGYIKNIGDCILSRFGVSGRLPLEFYFVYARSLIDIGEFKKSERHEVDINTIFKEIRDAFKLNSEQSIELMLIESSYYEHTLDYEAIAYNYFEINKLLDKLSNSNKAITLKATYLRNSGLVEFHGNLENKYKEAIKISIDEISKNSEEKRMIVGTCWNNLGQCYFYQGKLKEAIRSFENSIKLLDSLKYDVHRPLNNIAACNILKGDFADASKSLNLASLSGFLGVFEKISIELNMAVCQWHLKKEDLAIELVSRHVKDYKSNNLKTPDTWVYTASMYILAYFHLCKKDYFKAMELYKESKFHRYRFSNDLEQNRRDYLISYCLKQLDLPFDKDILKEELIDFDNVNLNIYRKPFDIQLLAFYIV